MEYKIPLFDLNFGEEEIEAVVKTIHLKWISTGSKTIEFKTLFPTMLRADYALALSNCTTALYLAISSNSKK